MSTSRSPLLPACLLIALAAIAASPGGGSDEAENYRRLQAMPRERRVALAENLERFDKLPPDEQAAIRKLDSENARKDEVERARYRALLRRYHLWVNGLTKEQKQALSEAGSDEARFNLARKYRLKELENAPSSPRVSGIRTGDYGLDGPHEVADLLRIWAKLSDAKKAEIGRRQERGRIFAEIRAQRKAVSVPFQFFPLMDEKFYDSRIEADPTFRKLLGLGAGRADAAAKKGESTPTKTEIAQKKSEKKAEHPFAEFLYFEDHKPKAVSASCPAWFHAMLDPLSADDARAYLTIVYRLLYPEPTEMPAEPPKPAAGPATAPPKPSPKKSGTAGPF
jgi:hypothetical protein